MKGLKIKKENRAVVEPQYDPVTGQRLAQCSECGRTERETSIITITIPGKSDISLCSEHYEETMLRAFKKLGG